MSENIQSRIKSLECQFNDRIFSIINGVDQGLELDDETFAIIVNEIPFYRSSEPVNVSKEGGLK